MNLRDFPIQDLQIGMIFRSPYRRTYITIMDLKEGGSFIQYKYKGEKDEKTWKRWEFTADLQRVCSEYELVVCVEGLEI